MNNNWHPDRFATAWHFATKYHQGQTWRGDKHPLNPDEIASAELETTNITVDFMAIYLDILRNQGRKKSPIKLEKESNLTQTYN
jgi:hypothetical protein